MQRTDETRRRLSLGITSSDIRIRHGSQKSKATFDMNQAHKSLSSNKSPRKLRR